MGFALLDNGRIEESEDYFRQYFDQSINKLEMVDYHNMHNYAAVLLANGKKEEGLNYARRLQSVYQQNLNEGDNLNGNYELAKIYSILGEKDKSLKHLRQYLDEGVRWGLHAYAENDLPFASIKDDPEFIDIIEQAKKQVAEKRAWPISGSSIPTVVLVCD